MSRPAGWPVPDQPVASRRACVRARLRPCGVGARRARRPGGRVRFLRPRPELVAGLLRARRRAQAAPAMRAGRGSRLHGAWAVAAIRERLSERVRAGRPLSLARRARGGAGRVPGRGSCPLPMAPARHLLGPEPGRLLRRRPAGARRGAHSGTLPLAEGLLYPSRRSTSSAPSARPIRRCAPT